jgi:hypothetical protein
MERLQNGTQTARRILLRVGALSQVAEYQQSHHPDSNGDLLIKNQEELKSVRLAMNRGQSGDTVELAPRFLRRDWDREG